MGAAFVVALSATTAVFISGQPTAAYAEATDDQNDLQTVEGVSFEDDDAAQMISELRQNETPERVGPDGEVIFDLVEPESGFSFSLTFETPVEQAELTEDELLLSPMVTGGPLSGGGFYISFNRTEQQIIATLGGAVLGAAICMIPGVGAVACRFITPTIAAAYSFLGSNSPCNTLRINVKPFRPPAVGVATVPMCLR